VNAFFAAFIVASASCSTGEGEDAGIRNLVGVKRPSLVPPRERHGTQSWVASPSGPSALFGLTQTSYQTRSLRFSLCNKSATTGRRSASLTI
jgi:hypothetical protein